MQFLFKQLKPLCILLLLKMSITHWIIYCIRKGRFLVVVRWCSMHTLHCRLICSNIHIYYYCKYGIPCTNFQVVVLGLVNQVQRYLFSFYPVFYVEAGSLSAEEFFLLTYTEIECLRRKLSSKLSMSEEYDRWEVFNILRSVFNLYFWLRIF